MRAGASRVGQANGLLGRRSRSDNSVESEAKPRERAGPTSMHEAEAVPVGELEPRAGGRGDEARDEPQPAASHGPRPSMGGEVRSRPDERESVEPGRARSSRGLWLASLVIVMAALVALVPTVG